MKQSEENQALAVQVTNSNLNKLIKLMESLRPKQFNMNKYTSLLLPVSEEELLKHQCGTAACALGWFTKIEPITKDDICTMSFGGVNTNRTFMKYSKKQFPAIDTTDQAWNFLFAGEWPSDIELFIERAEYYIMHGEADEDMMIEYDLLPEIDPPQYHNEEEYLD